MRHVERTSSGGTEGKGYGGAIVARERVGGKDVHGVRDGIGVHQVCNTVTFGLVVVFVEPCSHPLGNRC